MTAVLLMVQCDLEALQMRREYVAYVKETVKHAGRLTGVVIAGCLGFYD